MSRTYVGRVMSGKRTPTIHVCAKIAAYLGITLDQFYIKICEAAEAEKVRLRKNKGKKPYFLRSKDVAPKDFDDSAFPGGLQGARS